MLYNAYKAIGDRGSHAFDLKAEELGEGNAWFYQIGGADWMETRQMTRF